MARALERLLRLQRGDLPRGLLLFAYLFLVIAAYLVGQVARDALFLGRFNASLLPFADLSLFLFVAAAVARLRPRRAAARRSTGCSSAASSLFGVGGARAGRPGPRHARGAGSSPSSTSGSASSACWRPRRCGRSRTTSSRRARRAGSSASWGRARRSGATVGGVLSSALARRFGAESLLVARWRPCCCSRPCPSAPLWRSRPATVGGAAARRPARGAGLRASLRLVLGSAHLRAIAGIVVLSSFVTAVAGWQFKAMAQQALVTQGRPGRLLRRVQRLGRRAVRGDAGAPDRRRPAAARARARCCSCCRSACSSGSAGLLAFGTLAAGRAPQGRRQGAALLDRPAGGGAALPAGAAPRRSCPRSRSSTPWPGGPATASPASRCSRFATLGGLGPVRLEPRDAAVHRPVAAARLARRTAATWRRSRRACSSTASTPSAPRPQVLDRETTEVLAARLGAVDPKEILYALDVMAVGRQRGRGPPRGARPARPPGPRGALPGPRDPERGGRPLGPAAGGGAAARSPRSRCGPRRSSTSRATPTSTRSSRLSGPRRLPRLLGARGGGGGARPARRGAARGGASRSSSRWSRRRARSGGRTRLEAARLAERMPLPFEDALRRLVAGRGRRRWRGRRSAPSRGTGRRRSPAPLARAARSSRRSPSEAADALVAAGDAAPRPAWRRRSPTRGATGAVRRAIPGVLERIGGAGGGRGARGAPARGRRHAAPADPRRARPHPRPAARPGARPGRRSRPPSAPRSSATTARTRSSAGRLPRARGRRPSSGACAPRCGRSSSGSSASSTCSTRAATSARRGSRCARATPSSTTRPSTCWTALLRPEMKALLVPLVDPEVPEAQRVRLAQRLVGAPLETPEEAVAALAGTGDPWLRSCAAYAIGALGPALARAAARGLERRPRPAAARDRAPGAGEARGEGPRGLSGGPQPRGPR